MCSAESALRRRRARPQASLTATHSSTLAEEVVALLRTLHALGQWNGLINKYINSQLHSVTRSCAGKPAEGVGAARSCTLVVFLCRMLIWLSDYLFKCHVFCSWVYFKIFFTGKELLRKLI